MSSFRFTEKMNRKYKEFLYTQSLKDTHFYQYSTEYNVIHIKKDFTSLNKVCIIL